MSFAIPFHRLRETSTLLAFSHPQPSYPAHILIVPKRPIASLVEITQEDHLFLVDLFECVKSLVQEFNLDCHGYRLIVNGGDFQEFPQLHFHLISEQ